MSDQRTKSQAGRASFRAHFEREGLMRSRDFNWCMIS